MGLNPSERLEAAPCRADAQLLSLAAQGLPCFLGSWLLALDSPITEPWDDPFPTGALGGFRSVDLDHTLGTVCRRPHTTTYAPDYGSHDRYWVPMATSSSWLVSSSSFLLLDLSPGSSPSLCPLPLFLGVQKREDAPFLPSVALRLGTLALAGFLVSLLMLISSIDLKMLWGSLRPPNFQSAVFPECLGGRVGCCGDVGDPVGGTTPALPYIHTGI